MNNLLSKKYHYYGVTYNKAFVPRQMSSGVAYVYFIRTMNFTDVCYLHASSSLAKALLIKDRSKYSTKSNSFPVTLNKQKTGLSCTRLNMQYTF